MFHKETALPGEVEVSTSFGSLLGHRIAGGDIVLTTGLDRERLKLQEQSLLAYVSYSSRETAWTVSFYDAASGILSFEDRIMASELDAEGFVRTRFHLMVKSIVDAAAATEMPPSTYQTEEAAHLCRLADARLLYAINSERMSRVRFDELREHYKATGVDLSRPGPDSLRNAHFVETPWGMVMVRFHGTYYSIEAGGRFSIPLKRRRFLRSDQEVIAEGYFVIDEATGKFQRGLTDDAGLLHLLDDASRKPITPSSLIVDISREVYRRIEDHVAEDKDFAAKSIAIWKEEEATRAREQLVSARQEVHDGVRARAEARTTLANAMAFDRQIEEFLPAI